MGVSTVGGGSGPVPIFESVKPDQKQLVPMSSGKRLGTTPGLLQGHMQVECPLSTPQGPTKTSDRDVRPRRSLRSDHSRPVGRSADGSTRGAVKRWVYRALGIETALSS